MVWLRRWWLFLGIYALATAVAVREYAVARSRPPVAWPSPDWSRMVDAVAQINPDKADTYWLESMEARAEGDLDAFVLLLEKALASDVKHNEYVLQDYTQLMLDRGADYRIINQAANRWRENYAFSARTLVMLLGAPPRTPSEAAAFNEAMARISWIGGWRVGPYKATREPSRAARDSAQWQLELAFRPGRTIDIRQAVEAVTVLSLTEEQRAQYDVTCLTLTDCRLVPPQ